MENFQLDVTIFDGLPGRVHVLWWENRGEGKDERGREET